MSDLCREIRNTVKLEKVGRYLRGKCPCCEKMALTCTADRFYCFCCHKGGTSVKSFRIFLSGVDKSKPLWNKILSEFKRRIFEANKNDDKEEIKKLTSAFLYLKDVVNNIDSELAYDLKESIIASDRCKAINSAAAKWFANQILDYEEVLKYVRLLEIDDSKRNAIQLGYFPRFKCRDFVEFMESEGFKKSELANEGLIIMAKLGPHSALEDRIVYPVRYEGDPKAVVGFIGKAWVEGEDRFSYYDTHEFTDDVVEKVKNLFDK